MLLSSLNSTFFLKQFRGSFFDKICLLSSCAFAQAQRQLKEETFLVNAKEEFILVDVIKCLDVNFFCVSSVKKIYLFFHLSAFTFSVSQIRKARLRCIVEYLRPLPRFTRKLRGKCIFPFTDTFDPNRSDNMLLYAPLQEIRALPSVSECI